METATDLIKQLRASGLKQTEIARLTKIPQFRLSRWEAKGAPPAANDALKLVRLLGTVTANTTPHPDGQKAAGEGEEVQSEVKRHEHGTDASCQLIGLDGHTREGMQ